MKSLDNNKLVGKWIEYPANVEFIRKFAPSDLNIIILGDTGVGKGALASLIVANSNRKDKRFVDVNCSTISDDLLESTLFGHIKGSFTSAYTDHIGYFEEANGGTIFLDEIAETTHSFQTKILKVIETGQFRKLGDTKDIKVDVRLLFATNKYLIQEVQKGNFRADLYYRIKQAEIRIPPLRNRPLDIPILVDHFLGMYSRDNKKIVPKINLTAIEMLKRYNWPGNIRELKDAIRYAIVMAETNEIFPEDLPKDIRSYNYQYVNYSHIKTDNDIDEFTQCSMYKQISDFFYQPYGIMIDYFTKEYLIDLVEKTKGNILQMTKISKLNRNTIYKKINNYKIPLDKYKK